MSGAQTAAASAVVLEMDTLPVERTGSIGGGSQHSLHSRHSVYSTHSGEHSTHEQHQANGSLSHVAVDIPTVVVSEGQLDIRDFYETVKAPGATENLKFAAEVDERLKMQEEKVMPPEDILDQGGAEGMIFGKWLINRLGSANHALVYLTQQKWLPDNLTATIVRGLFHHHGASAKTTDGAGKTCLHWCAAHAYNFTISAIFENDSFLWMARDNDGNLPLNVALDCELSETAILIMEAMPNKDVRDVFDGNRRPFSKLLHNFAMKDVSHAILDRMLEAWPEEEKGRGFDFHFGLLESDQEGRTPDTYGFEGQNSCFLSILKTSSLAEEFSQDRVVRMLLYTKWNSYGEKMLWVSTLSFMFFMAMLTFADVTAVDALNPEKYTRPVDYARAVCEGLVILVLIFSLVSEVIEFAEKRVSYLKEIYNYVQLSSIVLILIVIPLRFLDLRSQWVLLALGYMLTTIRIFKFISASSLIGVYTRVLVGISSRVLPKFFLIFAVALFVWGGAFYPALRSHTRGTVNTTEVVFGDNESIAMNVTTTTIEEDKGLILELSNYGEVLFLGFRVLVEGRNLIQYYQDSQQLGALPVILYLLLLIGIVLIMRTILIAQMAATFGVMNRDAVRQVEMNRAWVLPDLEASKLWDIALSGWRLRFFEHSAGFSNKEIQEILQEEKVDGFLKLEKLLAKQKHLMEAQQQQTICQLTHQTILQDKWTSQLRQAIEKAQQKLGADVKAMQEVTDVWGSKTSAGIMSVRNHLSGQLEEAQTEQERAAQTIQERILQQTLDITTNIGKVEQRLTVQEQRQQAAEKALGEIDTKLVKQGEQGQSHSKQINILSESEAVSSERKDKKLEALEERLERQEDENQVLTKRLNQQGFQLEQVVEMLQRLEVSSNKLISEVSMLRRSARGVDFSATFDEKRMHFETQQKAQESTLPQGLAGLASSISSSAPGSSSQDQPGE